METQHTKNKEIWVIVQDILINHGYEVDGISIHESDTSVAEEAFKIYSSEGYCFELQKIYALDPDELDDSAIGDTDEEGYVYCFDEPWTGFNEAGIDKAIELLGHYDKVTTNS